MHLEYLRGLLISYVLWGSFVGIRAITRAKYALAANTQAPTEIFEGIKGLRIDKVTGKPEEDESDIPLLIISGSKSELLSSVQYIDL